MRSTMCNFVYKNISWSVVTATTYMLLAIHMRFNCWNIFSQFPCGWDRTIFKRYFLFNEEPLGSIGVSNIYPRLSSFEAIFTNYLY